MKGIDTVIAKETLVVGIPSGNTQINNPAFDEYIQLADQINEEWIADHPEPVFQQPGFETETQDEFNDRHDTWQGDRGRYINDWENKHPAPERIIFNIIDPENNAPLHIEDKELIGSRDEPGRETDRTDDFKATAIPPYGEPPPIRVQTSDSARVVPTDEWYTNRIIK